MTVNLAHEASIDIAAAPADVYNMVSDLTRMGEWSPESTGGKWSEGSPSQVGATFIGTNEMASMGDMPSHAWESSCEITVAEPGSQFEFIVRDMEGGGPYSRWTYSMQDNNSGGTKLTEAWIVDDIPPAMAEAGEEMLTARNKMVADGIEATLAAIKASAEA